MSVRRRSARDDLALLDRLARMSQRRHTTAGDQDREGIEYGPNGRALCRWCRTEVSTKQRTFCGNPECVYEWSIRSNGSFARHEVYKRDHGICALCGLNCSKLKTRLRQYDRDYPMPIIEGMYFRIRETWRRKVLGRDAERSTLWDVDHIIPVIHGGGSCGLDNLRTLCIWCHKRATRLLAKRRAKTTERKQPRELVRDRDTAEQLVLI